jgi:3-methyladenine DNA glycosylase AlkC
MAELLKNIYNKKFINDFSSTMKKAYPKFDAKKFSKLIFTKEWEEKELKERMRHIAISIHELLPSDYPKAIKIMVDAAEKAGREGFEYMFFPDFVEVYGMDHWDLSIKALEKMTVIASGEFAIRQFILKDHKKVAKTMLKWSKHKNHHVRRLASEGIRPRLPWSVALPMYKKDPSLIFPILENLKNDPELYVRRSVANNLNDISKDNPEKVIKLLITWSKDKSAEMKWVIKHSLRTLEKQGHPQALALLGYSTKVQVEDVSFKIRPKKISMGEKLELSLGFKSKSKKKENIVVDYIVYHKKANGELTPKVFKWAKKSIGTAQELEIQKKHLIKEISTRKYYSGIHEIHIQINGKVVAKDKFTLRVD